MCWRQIHLRKGSIKISTNKQKQQMNTTRDQVWSCYGPEDSCSRLKTIQRLCTKLKLDAILAIGGSDGKENIGSTRLINYLLGGMSGHFLSENILFKEQLEDLFFMVTPEDITVYVNALNYKYIQDKISGWNKLRLIKIDTILYHNDKDSAEVFKIESFISTVQRIKSNSIHATPKVGFPLTPTSDQATGNKFEVEQFPLVQAYAIEEFKTGSFFTQAFDVESIFHELNKIYCDIDSQSFRVISTIHNSMLLNQWLMVLQNFDLYLSTGGDTYNLQQLQKRSEEYFGEPLITYYKYAHIRNANHKKALSIPSLSFSGRDVFNTTPATLNGFPGSKHFTLVASDPHAPIGVARTYFLSTGALQLDKCLDGLLEEGDYDYVEQEVRTLMDLYLMVIKCFTEGTNRGFSSQNDFADFVSDFFSFYHIDDCVDKLLEKAKIESKLVPLDLNPYILNEIKEMDRPLLFYYEIHIKNIELSQGCGSLIYGNTIARTNLNAVNLTKAYSDFECWFATERECRITKLLQNNLVNRLTNMHDTMGRLVQGMSISLLFVRGVC